MEQLSTTCPRRLCVCASERVKLVSTLEGRFPDLGHHLENEMGGLWMQPIKLLDGFWMHFRDQEDTADCWLAADGYTAHPYGNTFHYRQGMGHTGVEMDLHQLAPEGALGLILRYELNNRSNTGRRIVLAFLARTDLRPAWSAAAVGAPDSGQDTVNAISEQGTFHVITEGHPWHVMIGSDTRPDRTEHGQLWGPELTEGKGVSLRMEFELYLEPFEERSLYFFVAGSLSSREDCALQYRTLATETQRLWQEKIRRMELVADRARLVVADEEFSNIYRWVKYNTDWLAMETPAGRGIAAGLPEYAWWFGCDSCYTVQGLLCMGDIALARDTLRLLLGISREQCGDGRIVHEIVGDGSVYHLGNVQETAHFIDTLWRYYQWTRDEELLWEALPYLDKSVKWLLDQDDDKDLFPSGYGIIEIPGMNLELIDSAVYTAKAWEAYAKICRTLGMEQEREMDFGALAERLADKINQDFWDEQEGLYCDVVARTREVQEKLEPILRTVPESRRGQARACLEQKLRDRAQEPEQGWLLNENWVICTPMEMELAPRRQAERALERMHTPEFIGEYGMYLSGMSQRGIMTISTGVMAAAQVRYGYADRALELLCRMGDSFGRATPGSISEMSPDYGCFVQAWTAYAMFVPVVTGFFGVNPKGDAGEIELRPCMPKAWKQAQLQGLPVLNGELSLRYWREEGLVRLEIENHTDYPLRLPAEGDRLLGPGTHCLQWKETAEGCRIRTEEEKDSHDPL